MNSFGEALRSRNFGPSRRVATTCEDYHAIDLAWLRHKGVLKREGWSTITWSRGGEHVASIGIKSEGHSLRLRYRARSRGTNEWEEIDQRVAFAFTDTNFGGRRRWFECPSCDHRCRVLYGGKSYRCSKCHKLKYESQYETSWGRAETQADQICQRLGRLEHDDDSLPPKPKGMHWATYERLARRYEIVTGAFACETSFRKRRSTMFGFKALLVFTSILVFTVGISTLPVKADGHAELKAKTFDLRRPNLTTTPACQPYERTDTICRAKGMYCTQYHANCCNPPKYWTFYWNKYGRCA